MPETMDIRRRNYHEAFVRKYEEERRIFDDICEQRKALSQYLLWKLYDRQGPKWYQVLSPRQEEILDSLERAIEQDVLEDKAIRTQMLVTELGVLPVPTRSDIMICIFHAEKRPLPFMIEIFKYIYDKPINLKLPYMAFVKQLLEEKFAYKPEPILPPPKLVKKKTPKQDSPYLERMVISMPPKFLKCPEQNYGNNFPGGVGVPTGDVPSLTDLQEMPHVEDEVYVKPRPPPPPTTRRVPTMSTKICDKIAGIVQYNTKEDVTVFQGMVSVKKTSQVKMRRRAIRESKQRLALGLAAHKRRVKIPLPPLPYSNTNYNIVGVAIFNGKSIFILNGVCIERGPYYDWNKGIALVEEIPVMVHGGLIPEDPPPICRPCGCMERYDQVIEYIEKSKCRCGHFYDFDMEEGEFDPTAPVYFTPPRISDNSPFEFHYDRIFELNEKNIFIDKLITELVRKDSVIGTMKTERPRTPPLKRVKSKCLYENPSSTDILKCTLRSFRDVSVLATLPDAHLIPELVEWMRFRIHGPLSQKEIDETIHQSKLYWDILKRLAEARRGSVKVPKLPYPKKARMNWFQKNKVREYYDKVVLEKFRKDYYFSQAKQYNIYWNTMYQNLFPNKKFRRIFFSYYGWRLDQYHVLHPYNAAEADRHRKLSKGCPLT